MGVLVQNSGCTLRKILASTKVISRIAYQSGMAFCIEKRFPILRVSVSYITRILDIYQDIKPPDIAAISNNISGDITPVISKLKS